MKRLDVTLEARQVYVLRVNGKVHHYFLEDGTRLVKAES